MAMRQGAYEWRATACLAGPTTAPQPPACTTASCPFDSLAGATQWAQQRNHPVRKATTQHHHKTPPITHTSPHSSSPSPSPLRSGSTPGSGSSPVPISIPVPSLLRSLLSAPLPPFLPFPGIQQQ